MKYLLILFILSPCVAIAQDFDYWGAKIGYTHTNRSHNLIFAGASLNTKPDLGGISLYGGTHIGFHSDMPSKVQIIPEVGAENLYDYFRRRFLYQHPRYRTSYRTFGF